VRRFAIMTAATLMAVGAAACGSSSKSSSSNPTTTVASSTTPTSSSTPTTEAKIDCSGTSAFVTDIGNPTDFKPVTPDTLTVVTSLPGP
jgi:hypothetical protein